MNQPLTPKARGAFTSIMLDAMPGERFDRMSDANRAQLGAYIDFYSAALAVGMHPGTYDNDEPLRCSHCHGAKTIVAGKRVDGSPITATCPRCDGSGATG